MKHVKLFEGWEQGEMDFKMSSEHFQKMVNAAMQTKSPADVARLIKATIDQNPHLTNDVENMRALNVVVKDLTDDEKEVLKNEFDPAGAEKRNQATAAKQAKLKAASDLLDSFESGETNREEFIRRIAGVF
jgi:hypothetical protein